jgi:16S rRNA U1498 N3-methylase RsmE
MLNPLNAKLNPIRHLLALAGAHHFVAVSRIRVNYNFKSMASPDAEVRSSRRVHSAAMYSSDHESKPAADNYTPTTISVWQATLRPDKRSDLQL